MVCFAVCTVCVQYHDVVLNLTEDGYSLEAVGQEAEETVAAVYNTPSNRP